MHGAVKLQLMKYHFEEKQKQAESEEVKREVPTFDVRNFEKKRPPPPGYLSPEVRAILSREPEDRTEDDIDLVEEELEEISFFKRFPYAVRRKLAGAVFFSTYTIGHEIVKEGREALSMYVVIAGVLFAYKETVDSDTGEKREVRVAEICHDSSFGARDLLHRRPREYTVKCRTTVQLLRLEKEDFDLLIRDIMLRDETFLEKNLRSIKAISEFEWSDNEYEELKKQAQLNRFPAHTVILGGTKEPPYYVHFIARGECVMEQDVEFFVEHGLGYKRLRPVPPAADDQSPTGAKTYRKRLEICHMRYGHYFGMGEDLSSRYIRAIELVEAIMIPRHILLLKKTKLFDRLTQRFESSFPTLQQILDKYLEVLNWQKFRQKTMRQVLETNLGSTPKTREPPFVKYF